MDTTSQQGGTLLNAITAWNHTQAQKAKEASRRAVLIALSKESISLYVGKWVARNADRLGAKCDGNISAYGFSKHSFRFGELPLGGSPVWLSFEVTVNPDNDEPRGECPSCYSSLCVRIASDALGGSSRAQGCWTRAEWFDLPRITEESVTAYLDAVYAVFFEKWADWRLALPPHQKFDNRGNAVVGIGEYKYGESHDFFAAMGDVFPSLHSADLGADRVLVAGGDGC